MLAHKRRSLFASTVLRSGTLRIASHFAEVCANCALIGDRATACTTRCWESHAYCFLRAVTNVNSHPISQERPLTSKTTKKGRARYETQNQHFARRGFDS